MDGRNPAPFRNAKMGMGQNKSHQGTAGFGPCLHLPGFHFGYLFLTHSQMMMPLRPWFQSGARFRPSLKELRSFQQRLAPASRCATLVGILVAAQHVLVELQAGGCVCETAVL